MEKLEKALKRIVADQVKEQMAKLEPKQAKALTSAVRQVLKDFKVELLAKVDGTASAKLTKVKGKRGRPAKAASVAAPAKKRGRPRKVAMLAPTTPMQQAAPAAPAALPTSVQV